MNLHKNDNVQDFVWMQRKEACEFIFYKIGRYLSWKMVKYEIFFGYKGPEGLYCAKELEFNNSKIYQWNFSIFYKIPFRIVNKHWIFPNLVSFAVVEFVFDIFSQRNSRNLVISVQLIRITFIHTGILFRLRHVYTHGRIGK